MNLLGLLGMVELATDKGSYLVGETPTYLIRGGLPNAAIAWSSFRNGVATGEYQAFYDQRLDAQGNATIQAGGPWTDEYVGNWQKQIIIIDPDNPNNPQSAQTFFTISRAGEQPVGSDGQGFFEQTFMGIPIVALIGGGFVAALAFARR